MKTKDKENIQLQYQSQDQELFYKISEGEYKSLETLFNKYYENLCDFGLRYESNLAIVEEKIADVFILLWNKRKQLKSIDNPKPYIYVIAKNNLIKKTKIKLMDRLDENYGKHVLLSPSKEEEMIVKEEEILNTSVMLSIMDKIPKKSLRIFELSRIDGFKYKEISEIVGLSPRTVENHIALAMKYIRKELEELNKNRT
ncbi:RNA polymerase sigma factor [Formosa sp. L2A11]|uniref:RNA polymerase sigma factor n=1 Tax=Formosa sp. L2A11 TaxID=2686363 RepID=UPI00131B4186|nr:sigma-70 family RNA polymerase sigma factor [Formosa sp. L2A11]